MSQWGVYNQACAAGMFSNLKGVMSTLEASIDGSVCRKTEIIVYKSITIVFDYFIEVMITPCCSPPTVLSLGAPAKTVPRVDQVDIYLFSIFTNLTFLLL